MAAPRKDNIQEKILEATCDLLKSKTLGDISLADIAKAAGISKGTLYYYYKTKNEIFLDITQRFLDEQWEDLIRWTENKDKDTSLNRLVRYVVERDIASAGLRIQLLSEAQLGDETLRQGLITLYRNFQGLIRQKIAERTDLPADFLTWLILLVSDGIIVQEAIGNSAFDREAFISEGIRHLGDISAADWDNT
ncbi:MAG: TetR/AcrR family transcriptional regulator [Faecousia sp.]